ncbi:MAG: glycosyltransferase [Chloroflexaceae bacterium]|nr:glycosyltransferase [Chloroflexaceae bacterium]
MVTQNPKTVLSKVEGSKIQNQERLGASYRLLGEVPPASDDAPLLLRVAVRNTGTAPWPNGGSRPINLAYHWLDRHGQPVDFEGVRSRLPAALQPGEEVELDMQIEPPPRPGNFQLMLDMVEEDVTWFSVAGAPGLSLPVTVAASNRSAPRAVIVNGNCASNDAVGNHLLNQMRYLQERGYQVVLLVEHTNSLLPPEIRQHIVQVELEELRDGAKSALTRRAVEHFHSADLYFFHYSTYYGLVEAIRLVGHGVTVFDYHGVTPPSLWSGAGREYLEEGQRRLELVRFADYAVAHSGFTRDELLHTGLIAPERVYQMGYVVPLERFGPGSRKPDLLRRYGLRPEQPLLLYVGRIASNKRVDDLVRALALLRERVPDAVLLIVGDNIGQPYRQNAAQIQALADELGLAEAVIFAGQVPDEELADHYRLASVFVTASVHEGFCIPVLEAMACGIPAVGANATALPETIGAGGLTFEPMNPADLAAKVKQILDFGF